MKRIAILLLVPLILSAAEPEHPDVTDWPELFDAELSDAVFPEGVWSFTDGVLTATKDKCIWTGREYNNFVLDLEFKTAPGTNSGVIVYCSNPDKWIPNSVEIQIADDYAKKWAKAGKLMQCGAVFGHLPATRSAVRRPGEWNRYTITCIDSVISVVLNGEAVAAMDMREWTSAKTNPDGSRIPPWLSKPKATLPTRGCIGLQGKHAGAPVYFRNILVKELPARTSDDVRDVWGAHLPTAGGKWREAVAAPAAGVTDYGSKGYRNTADSKGKVTAFAPGFPKEGPKNAFDGGKKKYCVLGRAIWLQYEYPEGAAHTVTAYAITTANDHPKRDPKDWQLLGSSDGVEWSVVDERKGEKFKSRYQSRLFKAASPASYRMYKLDITANHGDKSSQLSELQLLEAKPK